MFRNEEGTYTHSAFACSKLIAEKLEQGVKRHKAFGTLNHNLLIAERKAYGLNLNAASFIKSFLTNRYQSRKIGESFSEREKIIAGVL